MSTEPVDLNPYREAIAALLNRIRSDFPKASPDVVRAKAALVESFVRLRKVCTKDEESGDGFETQD